MNFEDKENCFHFGLKYCEMKITKQLITILLFSISLQNISKAQNNPPISFRYEYPDKNDLDKIKLIVENTSPTKTFYYSIALQVYNDTAWFPLLSDINSLGTNEFFVLKPIKPRSKIVKYVSKSSRKVAISWLPVLSHHRTYGSRITAV
jgi:hypothetical protein